MSDKFDLELKHLKLLSEKLGNPYILYGFKNLNQKIDELYFNQFYRVKTLHKIYKKAICL
ncbi:hypothetical protein BGC07_05520 [Piscirickettsia litoralis]|uniref:Uncharacterized protein n=1 Tax=Piscirickettsia litoralis TaxID=1891921 RepID=A0ABX3A0U2_9GAMM|nr:hypothetical protein BGC07_05520 [Piscirickettsia litoralis]